MIHEKVGNHVLTQVGILITDFCHAIDFRTYTCADDVSDEAGRALCNIYARMMTPAQHFVSIMFSLGLR